MNGELSRAVLALLPALERFLAEGPLLEVEARAELWRSNLPAELPASGLGCEEVTRLLVEVVIPTGLPLAEPGFLSWVTTAPSPLPAAAQFAATLACPQKWWLASGSVLERRAITWLAEILGLGYEPAGSLVSGGAAANFTALAVARQHAGERIGTDPNRHGTAVLPKPRVYVGPRGHKVVNRAVTLLGLGRDALARIPQRGGHADPEALGRVIDEDLAMGATPIAVVATAGDADLGLIDPLAELAGVARPRGVFFHVDAAYGGLARLDPRIAPLLAGLAEADSVVVDPHKWLAVPVGCGAVLCRDRALLRRALGLPIGAYARRPKRPADIDASLFDHLGGAHPEETIEHSAPARGIAVWAALAELGSGGLAARITGHLDAARWLARAVEDDPRFELMAEPQLSICVFRYRPSGVKSSSVIEAANARLLAQLRDRGRVWPSSTRVDDKLSIRPCFLGPRCGQTEAELLLREIEACIKLP